MDLTRLLWTGLLAGLVVNVIDVPNSLLGAGRALPAWQAQLGIQPRGGLPAFFLTLHFLLGIAITYGYALAVGTGAGSRHAALAAVLIPVLVNRGFVYGMVMLGAFPERLFWGLSASLVGGGLLGGLLGCWLYRPW